MKNLIKYRIYLVYKIERKITKFLLTETEGIFSLILVISPRTGKLPLVSNSLSALHLVGFETAGSSMSNTPKVSRFVEVVVDSTRFTRSPSLTPEVQTCETMKT